MGCKKKTYRAHRILFNDFYWIFALPFRKILFEICVVSTQCTVKNTHCEKKTNSYISLFLSATTAYPLPPDSTSFSFSFLLFLSLKMELFSVRRFVFVCNVFYVSLLKGFANNLTRSRSLLMCFVFVRVFCFLIRNFFFFQFWKQIFRLNAWYVIVTLTWDQKKSYRSFRFSVVYTRMGGVYGYTHENKNINDKSEWCWNGIEW